MVKHVLEFYLGVFGQTECVQKRAIRMAKELEIVSDVQWELSDLTLGRKV